MTSIVTTVRLKVVDPIFIAVTASLEALAKAARSVTTCARPASVGQAIGALSQSMDDLAHVAALKKGEHAAHVAAADQHLTAAGKALMEGEHALSVHGKISELIGC